MNNTPLPITNELQNLVAKLQKNHDFMAWLLSTYKRKERIDDDQLIAQLKTTPEMFVRLALCKCPNPESVAFSSQIREIATYTHIDPAILANVIRQVDTLNILSEIPRKTKELNEGARIITSGLLAAARDKAENEEDGNVKTNDESKDKTGGDDVAR